MVETVMALGIVSFSLIPILGLLPVALSSTRVATTQTNAMNVMTAIATDLKANPTGVSPRYSINTQGSGSQILYLDEAGNASTALQTGQSRYKATIKTATFSTTSSLVRVTVTWPPQASGANITGSVDVVVSLDK